MAYLDNSMDYYESVLWLRSSELSRGESLTLSDIDAEIQFDRYARLSKPGNLRGEDVRVLLEFVAQKVAAS